MPPKAKAEKKAKKEKKKKKVIKTDPAEVERLQADREKLLQTELDMLNNELTSLKDRVTGLRADNVYLEEQVDKLKGESHEYLTYLERKTSNRQEKIISVSDANKARIDKIREEKLQLLTKYEQNKKALQIELMEKENVLAKAKLQLQELEYVKHIQTEQADKIIALEKQMTELKLEHSRKLQGMKEEFLKQKQSCENEAKTKVEALSKHARSEALHCLATHTDAIIRENQDLRKELQELIKKSKALQLQKVALEKKKLELYHEKQYADSLKNTANTRQYKVNKLFGEPEKIHEEQKLLSNILQGGNIEDDYIKVPVAGAAKVLAKADYYRYILPGAPRYEPFDFSRHINNCVQQLLRTERQNQQEKPARPHVPRDSTASMVFQSNYVARQSLCHIQDVGKRNASITPIIAPSSPTNTARTRTDLRRQVTVVENTVRR